MFALSRPCFPSSAFLVPSRIVSRLSNLPVAIAVALTLAICAPQAWAAPQATATSLAITSAGSPVSTVPPKTVVTLTATVSSGSTPVTPGTVNFCDATALSCTDIHLIGTAQLTGAGVATVRFRPATGTRSYKAVFVGTNTYAASSSAAASLAIPGTTTTTLSVGGNPGSYSLTGSVVASGAFPPPSQLSFQDVTNGNYVLGTQPLSRGNYTFGLTNTATVSVGGSSGFSASLAATGDLNLDGIPDLAVPNGNGGVKVLLGNGDGTFTAAATAPAGSYPFSAAIGDFNSDGKPDIAVVNQNGNNITILLGNGDGTFTAVPSSPSTGSKPWGIVTGDFNHDGNLDLAVTNSTGNTITILLGNGDGTFTPTASVATFNSPLAIVTADFNGDGNLDLAIASSYANAGCFNTFLGNGDGTFTLAPNVAMPPVLLPSSCLSLAAVDADRDGKVDILVADFNNRVVDTFLGGGNGTFAFSSSSLPGTNNLPVSLSVGDFNGDGIPDFVTVSSQNNALEVGLGTGNGSFTMNFPSSSASGTNANSAVAADFNGDGVWDVAVENGSTTLTAFTSSLSQTFQATLGNISPAGTSGTHQIQAVYPGDAAYSASTSNSVSLQVANVVTSLPVTASPAGGSYYGQQVVLTATLTPYTAQGHTTDGETVTFYANNTPIGTATLTSGVASLNVTSLPAGTDVLQATYGGDTIFAGGSHLGIFYKVVYATAVTLTASPTTSTYGQPVTLQATLSPAAMSPRTTDGEYAVDFYDGTTRLDRATLSSGVATLALRNPLSASTHSLTAVYLGDLYFASATSSAVPITVSQVTSTLTWAPASPMVYSGRQIGVALFNASSSVSGTIAYTATPTSGSPFAIQTYTIFAAGNYTLTAALTPFDKTDYTTASISVPFTVTPAPLVVVPQTVSRAYGTANPALSGSVTGALNSDTFAVAVSTAATITSPTGTYPITYTVPGSNLANYAVTPATGTLTISPATPSITWNAPTGITYGSALSTAQLNATASVPGSLVYTPALGAILPAGTQTLSVSFAPTDSTDYAAPPVTTALLNVNKAPLAITATSAARVFGAANPAFTGTVNGAVNGDTFAESFATAATPASIVGSYPIVPSVAGANLANYALTPANGALTISQAGTSTTFALSNSNLTLTSTVASLTSGTPTGSVGFYEGQTIVGTGTLANGTASYTATTFPAGNVVVSAQYSGDANFTQSASPPILVLSMTPAQTTLSVSASGSASDAITLAAASGFTGTLQLSCTGLPQNAICSFQPASVTFTGASNSTSATLSVQTGASASAIPPSLFRSNPRLAALAGIFWLPSLLLAGFAQRARKLHPRTHMLLLAILFGGLCTLVTACGSSAPTTPAGTSTIQVVATGPSGFTQTTSVTLTVQ
jgi:MBG domain (YGX type)/Bacterial Ig-like domain (group 3)/FG-GAP-like repeat